MHPPLRAACGGQPRYETDNNGGRTTKVAGVMAHGLMPLAVAGWRAGSTCPPVQVLRAARQAVSWRGAVGGRRGAHPDGPSLLRVRLGAALALLAALGLPWGGGGDYAQWQLGGGLSRRHMSRPLFLGAPNNAVGAGPRARPTHPGGPLGGAGDAALRSRAPGAHNGYGPTRRPRTARTDGAAAANVSA